MRTRIGFSVLMLLTAACSQDAFVTPAGDAGNDSNDPVHGGGDSGPDGGAVEASAPPGCDATKLPTDASCVIDDGLGVFASATLGSASGDGTKEHPLSSLEAAITLAKKSGKRVYACAETYPEQIQLQDGVSVFGYFACNAGWTVSTSRARVAAPGSPAATATNITSPTRVEAVDLVSPDFTTGGQSSIALLANNAPALKIVTALIHAGTGGKGADGTVGISLSNSNTINGANSWKDGVCTATNCTLVLVANTNQPQGGSNTCVGESGHDPGAGGAGGLPGEFQSLSFNGYIWNAVDQGTTAGYPSTSNTQTAQGGTFGIGGSSGAPGANGASGASGVDFGLLSASGYVPSDGTNGTAGAPGQGGGGAGGYNNLLTDYPPQNYPSKYGWGEPGAGGGAGGCPGLAGQFGKGGGASLGVVALTSGLTLENVTVETSAGGAGGAAGAPSGPTAGGTGGKPAYHTQAGGNGGAGGNAGVSGNGGGGPSVGIVYDKVKPSLSASKVTPGAGGAGVSQGIPSPTGLSLDFYMFGQ